MFAEFFITFREALEAALVVGIILAYLEKTRNTAFNRHVYLGVASGVLASLAVAALFQNLVGGFEGGAEKIFEGTLMVFAALMVTWMVFWMMRQEHVKKEIQDRVAIQITRGQALGLAFFTFISVLREGVETVIFVSAASAEGSAGSMVGVFAGFSAAVILAYILFETAVKVNVKLFFNLTSLMLIVFAAGILAHGMHEFQEAGLLPEQGELWNTKHILDDQGAAGGMMRTLTGYNDNPTSVEVASWIGYMAFVGCLYWNLERVHKII